jgi:cytochrome P450
MPALSLYEEVENVLTRRMKEALRTGEVLNMPDWVTDLTRAVALAIVNVDEQDLPGLRAFAHDELDRLIDEEWEAKQP